MTNSTAIVHPSPCRTNHAGSQCLISPSLFQAHRPEIRPLEPTLADVHAAIEHDPSLPKSTRDALCCSLRRVAKFLGRDLSQLPARLGALRYGIARLHHAQLGVSRKTLQNHIANLKLRFDMLLAQERLSGRGIVLSARLEGLSMTNSPIGACVWGFRVSEILLGHRHRSFRPSPRQASRPSLPTPPRSSSRSSPTIFINRSPAAGIVPRKLSRAGRRSP